jgi:Family of unknown function (DUF6058)
VVIKDLELERIPALAEQSSLNAGVTPGLIDAMLRYDSVVRPFAPFERGMSSRRRVIDDIADRFGLPWSRTRPPAPQALKAVQHA